MAYPQPSDKKAKAQKYNPSTLSKLAAILKMNEKTFV